MPPPRNQQTPPLAVLEEACHLLRGLPATSWLPYAAGSSLFVVVLLRFWSEMSRAPDGSARLMTWSLAVALAYGLMKAAHAVFGECLLDRLRGGDGAMPRLGPWQWLKLAAGQLFLHSTMPWVLALSSLALLPMAWAYSFYHNASILAVGHLRSGGTTSGLISRALRASHHAVRQNHYLIAHLSIVSFLLWLNLLALAVIVPMLLKSLTGIETAFSRSPMALLNTTLFAAVTAFAWLLASPFARAAYAVRCFESDAEKSGDDLKAALRRLAGTGLAATALAGLFLLPAPPAAQAAGLAAGPVAAVVVEKPTSPTPEAAPVPSAAPRDVEALDRAIRETLARPDFRWRLPRQKAAPEEMGFIDRMLDDFYRWARRAADTVANWINDLIRWIVQGNPEGDLDEMAGKGGVLSARGARLAMTGLLVALALGLAFLGARWILHRRRAAAPVAGGAAPGIDLHDENLTASDLPEDEWLRLAREKLAAGDLRLALRALFLGTLARLGERGLLAIMAGKTNGMYLRELGWRARGRDTLQTAFRENVGAFERCWYGTYTVSHYDLERFQRNHHLITEHGVEA